MNMERDGGAPGGEVRKTVSSTVLGYRLVGLALVLLGVFSFLAGRGFTTSALLLVAGQLLITHAKVEELCERIADSKG
ncbi:hypothetical protein [Raoultibacter timonensis]|uniref:DUF2892 family protein n=1 Tax=Raoultibacter timonensis TaxID=1907662 RepID=A0ABM7WF42_9ACTN|nr:hypothetical protein [Raoultibacter timonensis]BDE94859.1 hypothetical protein CE91St30_01920 [Raoultibacter timonensis]BDF49462.1 hypothetical protein CE91St31_01920 [Raoultibacter timonensis]